VKGNNIDFDSVDFVLNEFDEQSIEQAVLVKEACGGTVTVIGVDLIGELDNVLHLALAKGADKAAKISADESGADSHTQAKWLADAIKGISPDIVFAGVQDEFAAVRKIEHGNHEHRGEGYFDAFMGLLSYAMYFERVVFDFHVED
jgi:electron transfer flavoprotein alpha/beta subunit